MVGGGGLRGRLIGDEMRVGKTLTALGIDERLRLEIGRRQRGNNCTLIVCPKSAIVHWADHVSGFGVPSEQILTVDLPQKQTLRKILGHIARDKRKADAKPWFVIINWDTVQTIERELKNAGPWYHIIGDEIHRIKSRDTKRTRSFKKLKAKYRTGLSGTPADNRPEDFWSVLNWLYSDRFSSYWNFVERYCKVIELGKSGYKKIVGVNEDNLDELRAAIGPFYIRRLLVDVAEHVPQMQYRTITVGMSARQRREYNAMLEENIAEVEGGDIIAAIAPVQRIRLQQMAIGCCTVEDDGDVHITDKPASPKISAIMELINDEPELGPFIIFAQHHDTVRLTTARLRGGNTKTVSIIGDNSHEERSDAVRQFQSGHAECFVGTIGACRESLTLSRANTIIFIDRAWNGNHNRQAEARANSLDQQSPVTIVVIESENSIDQDRRLHTLAKLEGVDAFTETRA